MTTLQQAIDKMYPKNGTGKTIKKHLNAAGIKEWGDISRESLYEFRDIICAAIAPNSAKTVTAYFKAILNRYKASVNLPEDWERILLCKGDVSRSTYLTPEELTAFENVQTNTPKEKLVQVEFLIEAYTGARISDVMEFTSENFDGNLLTYTSKKTRITATVPVSEKTRGWIVYAQSHREDEPSMAGRELIIKRLAQRAGINEMVKTRRGGVEMTTPKCDVCRSHVGRISFVTNLQRAVVDLVSISRMAGHTNTQMTERYCAPSAPSLNEEAMSFLMSKS